MKHAFSLVELSIVLVILGLLTGGILTGQSLIRAAELRAVTTELQNYQTSVMTFRDKYFSMPGDMTNATAFWTQMTNCGAASPSGTGTQTCDGNGNGEINAPAAASQTGETFTFWQHLANAELIEGTYTGIAGSNADTDVDIGVNVPRSKLSNAGWDISRVLNAGGGNANVFAIDFNDHYVYGSESPAGSFGAGSSVLSPSELWGIDTKIDDGLPARGKVIGGSITTCTLAGSNTDFDADYNLANETVACHVRFINLL